MPLQSLPVSQGPLKSILSIPIPRGSTSKGGPPHILLHFHYTHNIQHHIEHILHLEHMTSNGAYPVPTCFLGVHSLSTSIGVHSTSISTRHIISKVTLSTCYLLNSSQQTLSLLSLPVPGCPLQPILSLPVLRESTPNPLPRGVHSTFYFTSTSTTHIISNITLSTCYILSC